MRFLRVALLISTVFIFSSCSDNGNQQANSTVSIEENLTDTPAQQEKIETSVTTPPTTTQEIYAEDLFRSLRTTPPKPPKTVYELTKPTDCKRTSLDGTTEEVVMRLYANCLGRVERDITKNSWVERINNKTLTKEFARDEGIYNSAEATCLRDSPAVICQTSDGSITDWDSVIIECNFDEVTVKYDRMANRLRSLCGGNLKVTISN